MLTARLIHHTSEGPGLADIVSRLAAVRLEMLDVELGLSRFTCIAGRLAGSSQSNSAARATERRP
ncbi:MAG: hypothetical protein FD152_2728 [Xanthobacteraceae bacterium]|nr:MAG: hypothetical protein FD152_2728 [Xanthobacteraceae bacterium]